MASRSTRRLLFLLAAAAGVALVGVVVEASLERLADAHARADRYEAQVRSLQRALEPESDLVRERNELKAEVAERNTRFYGADALTPYTFGTLVKKELVSFGLTVTRYQIVDVKGRSFLEFSLSGSPRGLLQFLREVSEQEKFWVIPSITEASRQGSSMVDVTFRIGYEVSDTPNN